MECKIMKLRKIFATGILVIFVIQAIVIISYSTLKESKIASFPKHVLEKKQNDKPSIFSDYFYENNEQYDVDPLIYSTFIGGNG